MKRSSITMTAILALLLSCTGCKSTVPKTPSTEAPASISENGLAISITSQPEAHYNLPGSTATFSVKAASETSLSYSWSYRRKADEPWEACDQSDMTTDTLSVSVTTDLDGSEYRCTITNEDGETVYSEPARLLLTIPLNSNYFPDDGFLVYLRQYDKNENSLLEYEERASVETIDLSYGVWNKANGETLWVRDLKGIEFLPKLSLLNCSGNELTTLDVTGCGALRSLWVDENVTVVGLNGNIQSTRTAPRTPAKLQITLQPSSETVSLGMKTSFRTYALGEGNLTYQWQYRKNDHTSTWTDFDQAVLSNVLTIEAKKEMAGYQVRCAVSDSAGATVYSESATLSILIPITPENFPDDNFREYIHQRAGKDYLSADDQEKWNSIEVSGLGIKSLEGIEFFPNLSKLDCSNNVLSSLDLPSNWILTELDCADNPLAQLDLSQLPRLTILDCSRNQLTRLTLNPITALEHLICTGNELTNLDLNAEKLITLYCSGNHLSDLDLSKASKLIFLDCSSNPLANLKLNAHCSLRGLYCQGNDLKTVSYIADAASEFVGYDNSVLYIETGVTALLSTRLYEEEVLSYQWQTRKDDAADWTSIDGETKANLAILVEDAIYGTQYRCELTRRGNVVWHSLPVTIKAGPLSIDEKHFPDEAFRQYIADEFDLDKDGNLSEYEIKEIKEIHLEGGYVLNGVKTPVIDLTGIEYFPNLEWLDCEENQLSSLDVSQNPLLWHLHCASNHLTALNVSQNPELYYLDCYDNQLSSLIISGAQKLSSLICSANMLTELDTSSNPELMDLYCHHNSIQKLDLSNCPNMMELSINADVPVTGIQEKVVVKRIRTEVISPTAEGLTPLEDGWYVSDNIDKEDSKDCERYGDAWFSKGKVEDGVLFLEGYLVPYQGGGITKLKVASDVEVYACGGTAEDDEADIEYFNDCFWSDEPGLYIRVYVENGVVTRIDICS